MGLKFRIVQSSILVLLACPYSAEAQTGNCVISGGVNNGLQIQNCPIIQAAPTPSFHVISEEPIKKNEDGTYTRSALISVDAPYVPNNMAVYAIGPTVKDIMVTNKSVLEGGKALDPGVNAFLVWKPSGRYKIEVKTSDNTSPPALEIKFNIDANVK